MDDRTAEDAEAKNLDTIITKSCDLVQFISKRIQKKLIRSNLRRAADGMNL